MRSRKLRGFTMPELLVFMVLAGIIFLIVMEGFGLFRMYGNSKAAAMTRSSEFYDGYHRLAMLAYTADSIADRGFDGFELYSHGQLSGRLRLRDSMVLFESGEMKDTLLGKVASLELTAKEPNSPHNDTLAVTLDTKQPEPLRISFAITPQKKRRILQGIEEQENRYVYEPSE